MAGRSAAEPRRHVREKAVDFTDRRKPPAVDDRIAPTALACLLPSSLPPGRPLVNRVPDNLPSCRLPLLSTSGRVGCRRPVVWTLLWLTLAASVGCDPPPRPAVGRFDARAEAELLQGEDLSAAPPPEVPRAHAGDWQAWQCYFIRGRQVGFNHIDVVGTNSADGPRVHIQLNDQLVLSSGSTQVAQRLEQHSVETPDGGLVSFQASLAVGPVVTHYSGTVEGDELVIVTRRGAESSTRRVPWDSTSLGLTGLQQTLRAQPLGRGESRRLTVLLPIAYDLATVQLNCQFTASIPMPDGAVRQAREIDVQIQPLQGEPYSTVIWTDDDGHILKSLSPNVNLQAFSCGESEVTAGLADGHDWATATSVAVRGTMESDAPATQVAFRFTNRGAAGGADQPAALLRPHPGQWVKPLPGGSFDVAVSRKPLAAAPAGYENLLLLPSAEDRRPNSLVDSGHNRVRQLASTAVAGNDQARLAHQLARSAHSLVRKSGKPKGLVAASTVAIDAEADQTGHAILLAAMLRARNIPARIAIGLVYTPSDTRPAMAYHMWTLAYVDDDWLHLDATSPTGQAAADRVVLATHTLAGDDVQEIFAPVLGVLERFEIEIIRANYGTLPVSSAAAAAD